LTADAVWFVTLGRLGAGTVVAVAATGQHHRL
jgi:hypothetical protein